MLMTLDTTICFLSNREALKERHVKAFAATVLSSAVKVTTFAALKTLLEKIRQSGGNALIIVDASVPLSKEEIASLRTYKMINYKFILYKNADHPLTIGDLAEASKTFAAICLSNVENLVNSVFLRFCVLQLRNLPDRIPIEQLFRWGTAQSFKGSSKLAPNLEKNRREWVGYLKQHLQKSEQTVVSDCLLFGQIVKCSSLSLADLQEMNRLKCAYKVVNIAQGSGGVELAFMDSLFGKRKEGSEEPEREFMIIGL